MIYIALTLVATPVVFILFFAVYKSILCFIKPPIRAAAEIPVVAMPSSPFTTAQTQTPQDDDEIAAVITAAVKVYTQCYS